MRESAEIVITVEKRPEQGRGSARRMRRVGQIPAVLYGGDQPPVSISVDEHSLKELLKQEAGENTIFLLNLEGTKEELRAMIREIQKDAISGHFLHIDFIRILAGQKVHVRIPVELTGDCLGVRQGGRVEFISRELAVEILPGEMFDKFSVDLSTLDVGHHVSVADLQSVLPPSARFLEDPHRMVVVVEVPKAEVEAVAPVGEAVIAEAAEPELIRKGKLEAEEGE